MKKDDNEVTYVIRPVYLWGTCVIAGVSLLSYLYEAYYLLSLPRSQSLRLFLLLLHSLAWTVLILKYESLLLRRNIYIRTISWIVVAGAFLVLAMAFPDLDGLFISAAIRLGCYLGIVFFWRPYSRTNPSVGFIECT